MPLLPVRLARETRIGVTLYSRLVIDYDLEQLPERTPGCTRAPCSETSTGTQDRR